MQVMQCDVLPVFIFCFTPGLRKQDCACVQLMGVRTCQLWRPGVVVVIRRVGILNMLRQSVVRKDSTRVGCGIMGAIGSRTPTGDGGSRVNYSNLSPLVQEILCLDCLVYYWSPDLIHVRDNLV